MWFHERALRENVNLELEKKPAILLWMAELNFRTDVDHIIWIDNESGNGSWGLVYGLLDTDGERVPLAAYYPETYEGKFIFPELIEACVASKSMERVYSCLRFLWETCLVTDNPRRPYRWFELPEQIVEALELNKRTYGRKRSIENYYTFGE